MHGEDSALYKAQNVLESNVRSIRDQYTNTGYKIIEEEFEKYRKQVDQMIIDGYAQTKTKTFDSNEFHDAFAKEVAKKADDKFEATDKRLKEEVIDKMIENLSELNDTIFDQYKTEESK